VKKNIKHLLSLLDDEDQQSASLAMAELLRYDKKIDPFLKDIQESDDPRLRKRAHQLQSILSIRRRRVGLPVKLNNEETGLIHALAELHFLWYDSDTEEEINQYWTKLLNKAKIYQPDTIEKLAYFMRKNDFAISSKEELDADYVCIGIVLEELVGADFMLCAIAQKIAQNNGLKLKVIRIIGDFALIDQRGQVLFPQNDWRLLPQFKKGSFEVWDNTCILKLTASILLTCAISTDSFRYIYTIGNCLAKICGQKNLDFLPFPYNT